MKTIILLPVLFFSTQVLSAQALVRPSGHGIKAAYMGSVMYPGFKIGAEIPYKTVERTKGEFASCTEKHLTLNLGMYRHKSFHTNYYMLAERQWRKRHANGYFVEYALGPGLSRTFLQGNTYTFDDDGQVSEIPRAGYFYGLISLSGGAGFDFSAKGAWPLRIYFKPSLLYMFPYNDFVYIRTTLELGFIYHLSRKTN